MTMTVDQLMKEIREAKPKAQNFHSHIFVPVIQNIVGGFSVGLLVFFFLSKGNFIYDPAILSFCIMISLIIAAIVNVYRLFGDDFIRPYYIFRLGQVFCVGNDMTNILSTIKTDISDPAYKNALKLITAHYKIRMGLTIKDANEKLKMSRQEFEAARDILIDKGIMANTRTNKLQPLTVEDALERMRDK